MSFQICQICDIREHLNDELLGYLENKGLCFNCFKTMDPVERDKILEEIGKRRQEERDRREGRVLCLPENVSKNQNKVK